MVTWLVATEIVVMLAICVAAAAVALFVEDKDRRDSAYKVLKLALTSSTGISGMALILIRLHEAGLL